MDALLQDLRYALRQLARAPGFTLVAVGTLALGIGANVAVFSALDTVLLRPLPFPDPGRLIYISHVDEASAIEVPIAPVRLRDWNERTTTFEAVATYYTEDVTDTTGDRPENVRRATVTPGFLDLWRIAPALGRAFADDEHRFGGPPAAIVSDRYWRERLGADPDVVGRTLRIDTQSVPIVGVMPASFTAVDRMVDVWMPHLVGAPWASSRGSGWFSGVVGRLEPGVRPERGIADLNAAQAQLAEQYPETDDLVVRAVPYKDTVVGGYRGSLWLLFGAVSLLLLIACSNIAALLLARAARRERDIAIRYSLGASRAAVAWHVFSETIVLVALGAAAGIGIAAGAVAGMRAAAAGLPRFDALAVDGRVLVYVVLSAVAVALLCGLLPSVRHARGVGRSVSSARGDVSGRQSLNWLLVGLQTALSVTLLAGAGLLLRSFDELARVDPGFEPDRVLTFRLSGSFAETTDYGAVIRRIDGTLEELTALPGIEAAATSFAVPGVSGALAQDELALVEGRIAEEPLIAETRTVSPSYFETLQIPLLAGEACGASSDEARQALVNRSFAERYFGGGRSPIGLHFVGNSPDRIMGIVGDARELGTHRAPVPTVYRCFSAPTPFPWFFVRTTGEPMGAAETVRARLNELEPLRSVYEIAPLEERIGDVHAENRLRALLLSLFAAAALALTCLGIYGTLTYIVSLRRREVGLRVALGALSRDIVRQFLWKALRVVGVACLAGLLLALAFGRALSGMLFGVSPGDPATLAGVVAVVLLVAGAAALTPAMRAARVDPMQALREE